MVTCSYSSIKIIMLIDNLIFPVFFKGFIYFFQIPNIIISNILDKITYIYSLICIFLALTILNRSRVTAHNQS